MNKKNIIYIVFGISIIFIIFGVLSLNVTNKKEKSNTSVPKTDLLNYKLKYNDIVITDFEVNKKENENYQINFSTFNESKKNLRDVKFLILIYDKFDNVISSVPVAIYSIDANQKLYVTNTVNENIENIYYYDVVDLT